MGNPINRFKKSSDIYSGSILWNGKDIPCIGLCNGDTVNEVIYKIATKICSMVSSYEDLSTLDYSCIIDLCNKSNCADLSNPEKVTLKLIFQTLLDNDCALQDLIKEIENRINNIKNSGLIFNLNLNCIEDALVAICKSTEDYSLNDLLQAMINVICDNQDKINTITNNVNSLSTSVNNLTELVESSAYTEPFLTDDCAIETINNGSPLILSDFVEQLTYKMCSLYTALGTLEQLQSALNLDPTIPKATNLAQNEYNQWVIINNLKDRIEYLENNCCNQTCEDINLGFSINWDTEEEKIVIVFDSLAGTNIPPAFTDCGSTIILTDTEGNSVVNYVTITNNSTFLFNVDSLANGTITATLTSCFANGSTTCSQNIIRTTTKS